MTAPAHTVVSGVLVAEQSEAEIAQLERQAARLLQRARDIRHTLAMLARPVVLARCLFCDAAEGDFHFPSCVTSDAQRGEVVS